MRIPIEKKVLKKIIPTDQEERQIKIAVTELKKKLNEITKNLALPLEVMLVGSIAKGTHLSGTLDIDLFILFTKETPSQDLEKIGLQIGKTALPQWEIQYANHPYVRGIYKSFKVDIVPCYHVENPQQKISAVDRTPFHTKYVIDNLAEKQKNDVRLLKRFLKGIHCYSAEEKIQGFSGYLAELLIIKYNSFRELLCKIQEWRPGETLTLTSGEHEVFTDPFVFIDPVDSTRNVASALSEKCLKIFLLACKAYNKKPKMEYFFPRKVTSWPLRKIEKKVHNFVGVQMPKPNVIDDILYSQLRKATKSLTTICEIYDFPVEDATYYVNDNITFILRMKTLKLSPTKLHMGPPINNDTHAQSFIDRWKDDKAAVSKPFQKESRWWLEINRDYLDVHRLLREKINDINLGTHINQQIKKSRILNTKDLLTNIPPEFWTCYLDNKMPWER